MDIMHTLALLYVVSGVDAFVDNHIHWGVRVKSASNSRMTLVFREKGGLMIWSSPRDVIGHWLPATQTCAVETVLKTLERTWN